MVNVFTGRGLDFCIKATIADESMPPERKAPNGTSATIRERTELVSKPSRFSIASSGVPVKGRAQPDSAALRADQ